MPLYEHIMLARQDISAQQVESMIETFQSVITNGGGTIGKSEYWGLKGLAYKIKKNRKAHFALFNIEAPHDAVAEMERQMRLSTDVIRFMTLKVAEHDNDPSPIMKRGDRDDRRGGRRDHRDRDRPRDRGPREERDTAKAAASVEKPADAPAKASEKTPETADAPAKEADASVEKPADTPAKASEKAPETADAPAKEADDGDKGEAS